MSAPLNPDKTPSESPLSLVGKDAVLRTVHSTANGINITLSGNTDGDLRLISSGTLTLFGGSNITLSQSLNSVTIDGAGGGGVIHAGTNITLSTAAGHTTISATGLAQSVHTHSQYFPDASSTLFASSVLSQTFLTTAAQVSHSHGTGSQISGVNATISSSSNGLTVSVGNYLTTAAGVSHTHGNVTSFSTSGTNLKYSSSSNGLTLGVPKWVTEGLNDVYIVSNTAGVITDISTGTFVLAGGSNITLSQDANTVTIVGKTDVAGVGTTIDTTSGTDLKVTLNTDGINISHPVWLTTGVNVSVGGSTHTSGTLANITAGPAILYGGNNITLSQESNSITISATETYSAIKGLGLSGDLYTSGTILLSERSNIDIQKYYDGTNQWLRFSVPDYVGTITGATGVGLTADSHGISVSLDTSGLASFGDGVNIIAVSDVTGASKGTVVFSDSNGVAFGMSTIGGSSVSTMTVSYSQSTHEHSTLASVYSINGSSGIISLATASSLSASTDGSTISIGLASNISTMWSGQTTANQSRIIQINGSSGSFSFAAASSLSASTNGSSISFGLASNITTALQSVGAYLTTAADASHSHGAPSISLSNFSSSSTASASSGFTLGLTGYPSSSFVNISDTGSIYFENSNGVSWATSIAGSTTTIFGSVGTNYAGISHSHGNPSISLSDFKSSSTSSASNGFTLGLSGYPSSSFINISETGTIYYSDDHGVSWGTSINGSTTTITASIANYAGTSFSTVATNGTALIGSINTAGISLSVPAWITTAGTGAADGGNIIAVSGSTAASTGVMAFMNANNITFGISDSTNVTASASFNQTSEPRVISLNGSSGSLSISASTNITVSNTGGTIILSVADMAGQSQQPMAFAVSGTTTTASTMGFVNSNGVSWSLSGSNVVGSVNTDYVAQSDAGSVYFVNPFASGGTTSGSNMTFGSMVSSNSTSIFITAGGGSGADGGNIIAAGGTTANSTATVQFTNSNGISFGMYSTSTGAATWSVISADFASSKFLESSEVGDIYFSNSNGVTFGTSTSTGTGGSSTTVTADFGSSLFVQTTETGNVYFSNSNGFTFGSTASCLSTTITGSYNSTQAMLGWELEGNNTAGTTSSSAFSRLYLSGGDNVTLSGNSNTIIISAGGGTGTGGGVGAISASNGSFSSSTLPFGSSIGTFFTNASGMQLSYTVPALGTLSFINSNGVSFGSSSDGSTTTVSASVETAYIPLSNSTRFGASWELEGNNTAGTTGSSYGSILYLSGGANVTLSGNSNTIVVSVNATGAADGGNTIAVSGSTASSNGLVALWNANNFSFGFSDSTRITASFSESTHAHSFVNQINGSSGSISFNTGSSLSSSANASGITIGLASDITTALQSAGVYLTTAMASNAGSNFAGTGESYTNADITLNSNGLQFDGLRYLATSQGLRAGMSTLGNTSGNTALVSKSLYLIGGSNITLSQQTDVGGNASLSFIGIKGFSAGISDSGNTGGSSGITGTRLVFIGSDNITLSQSTDVSGGTIAIYGASGGTGGGAALQGSGTYTQNSGTIQFANSNSITFGLTNNQMTASFSQSTHDHPFAGTGLSFASTDGVDMVGSHNTAGLTLSVPNFITDVTQSYVLSGNNSDTTAFTAGPNLTLVGSNNITLKAASDGKIAIVGAVASGNMVFTGNTAGGPLMSITDGIVTFVAGANITFVQSNHQVEIEAGAGTGGFSGGVSNVGNTGGSTGITGTRMVFAGSNNITLSQSTDASGGTISIYGGAGAGGTSIVPGDYLSSSLNGSTLSLSVTGLALSGHTHSDLYQSTGNYLTTAAQVSHSHGNPTLSLSNLSGATSSASDGLTISLTGYNEGYSATSQFSSAFPAQTSEPRVISLNGTSGVLSISGASNITVSALNGSTITIYGPSNILNSFSVGGNTGTTGSSNITGGGFVIAGGNNITLSQSNNTISIVGGAGGGGVANAASNTTYTSGTVEFRGTNITVSTSAGGQYVDLIALPAGTLSFLNSNNVSFGTSSDGNSTTITASIPMNTYVFSDSNGVSWGTSATGGSTRITASVNPGGVAIANSQTTYTSGTVLFRGTNATINTSAGGQYIDISVAAPGGGGVAISNSNTLWSSGTVVLSGSANITVGSAAGSIMLSVADHAGTGTAVTGRASITLGTGGISFNGTGLAGTSTNITGNASITLNSSGMSFNGSGLAGTNTAVTGSVAITVNSSGVSLNASSLAGTGTTITTTSGTDYKITLNSAGLNLAAPYGYLFFANSNGHSFTSSSTGVSTYVWIST